MKFRYIILIFAVVGVFFFLFHVNMEKRYLQAENISLNPVSYALAKSQWDSVLTKNVWLLYRYTFAQKKQEKMQIRKNELSAFSQRLMLLSDSLRQLSAKEEIVYVKRIALPPKLLMTAPAHYKERYSGSRIEASGRGADREQFCMFYLSDGKIIKASTRSLSEWLGVSVGDKVKKTIKYQISSSKGKDVCWFPFELEQNIEQDIWKGYKYFRVCDPVQRRWTIPQIEIMSDTVYQPLYVK